MSYFNNNNNRSGEEGADGMESPSVLIQQRHGPPGTTNLNALTSPFLLPPAIVRLDRSSSSASLHLTEAYRGNPYDIQAIRRRSEPTSQVISALKGLKCQAAGHPEYEMDYEEQPLDMSIKGKSSNSSCNSSPSSPPVLESTSLPMTQPFTSQISRPSVITCAPSLKVKSNIGSCSSECSSSHKCTHNHQNIPSKLSGDPNQFITNYPATLMSNSNGHSQDTIIANETAKLNIYCDSSESGGNADPVDEHFRRSLGKDFTEIFKSPSTTKSVAPSKCGTPRQPGTSVTSNGNSHLVTSPVPSTPQAKSSVTSVVTEMSTDVDDHFAKALGADWLKKLKKSDTSDKIHQENGFNG